MKTEIEILKSRHADAIRHLEEITAVKKAADEAHQEAQSCFSALDLKLCRMKLNAFHHAHPRAESAANHLRNISFHLNGRVECADTQIKNFRHKSPQQVDSKVSEATHVVEYSNSVALALTAMVEDFDCCNEVRQATVDVLALVAKLDQAFTTVACQTKHKPEDVETLYTCLHQVADAVASLVILSDESIARIGYELVVNDEKSRAVAAILKGE